MSGAGLTRRGCLSWAAALGCGVAGPGVLAAAGGDERGPLPTFRFDPGPTVLDGDPLAIRIEGLAPGEVVVVTAERWYAMPASRPQAPRLMRSKAEFAADRDGRLDLATAAPRRGTYRDADVRGLFWSMVRVPEAEAAPSPTRDPAEVRLRLVRPREAVEASVHLIPFRDDVVVTPAPGLPGAVFAAPRAARGGPAVILLGGSEGGSLVTQGAAPLASRGFAVLALPVYSPADATGGQEIPELPRDFVDIPVESLDRARDWLSTRPEVDPARIGLHGTSMGSVLALLGAIHLAWPRAVVANVPSDVVWEGWGERVALGSRSSFALRGQPLPFVPLVGWDEEMARLRRGDIAHIRRPHQRGRDAHPNRVVQARLPVERIRAELLVIGADDDQMWPSGAMARNIVERRAEHGLRTEALLYPDAGHLLDESGYAPTTLHALRRRASGGSAEANARARADVWTGTIRFLQRALG